jgi:dolichyl-phosphate-mannose--protein O-mannosyl transferase
MSKINHFLNKYEKYIPIILFFFYFIITVPGTSWGLPYRLHPQELIKVVFKALYGDWEFDSKIYIYTSLSKYVMFWIGKFFLWLDFSREQIYLAIRLFSVLLGAGVVSITYLLTRYAGGSIYIGLLASFLLISNSQLSQDSRFAHNDIYLTFFVCLTAFTEKAFISKQIEARKLIKQVFCCSAPSAGCSSSPLWRLST